MGRRGAGRSGRFASVAPAMCLFSTIFALRALAVISGGSFFIGGPDAVPAAETAVCEIPESAVSPTGVRVLSGSSATILISGYSFGTYEDIDGVSAALEALYDTLALYPEGFFAALTADGSEELIIELTGGISALDAGAVESPAAVTCSLDGGCVIAIDASGGLRREIIIHELCHAVDRRLDELAKADPSHWNDADWAALNPAGFRYLNSYRGEDGISCLEYADPAFTAEEEGEAWFVNRYSKTFPTEDRAVMMEYLFGSGPRMSCFRSPHIQAKLGYYFAAMRYYLDPGGNWGETVWERKLKAVTIVTAYSVYSIPRYS